MLTGMGWVFTLFGEKRKESKLASHFRQCQILYEIRGTEEGVSVKFIATRAVSIYFE